MIHVFVFLHYSLVYFLWIFNNSFIHCLSFIATNYNPNFPHNLSASKFSKMSTKTSSSMHPEIIVLRQNLQKNWRRFKVICTPLGFFYYSTLQLHNLSNEFLSICTFVHSCTTQGIINKIFAEINQRVKQDFYFSMKKGFWRSQISWLFLIHCEIWMI